MLRAIKKLQVEPAYIIDVGANEGQFSCAASFWYPDAEIISFEPNPSIHVKLVKRVRRLEGCMTEQLAVGQTCGEVDFNLSAHTHASSVLEVSDEQRAIVPSASVHRRIRVPMTTLDEYFAGKILPRPVLLKLDVQGLERQVLEGGKRILDQTDFLLVESSFRQMYKGEPLFSEMYDYVAGLGYSIVAPVGTLKDSSHVIVQADLLWRRSSLKL